MKRAAAAAIALLLLTAACLKPPSPPGPPPQQPIKGKLPTEVVDEVWRLATQGELLTPDGWRRACGFFSRPTPFPENKVILVMSNDWGPAFQVGSREDAAEVDLGYFALGKIDSTLRYTNTPSKYMKAAFAYHLVPVPSYLEMMGSDGKTLVEKRPVGYREWQIQDSPESEWTTVNTAIRYVLEKRDKAIDTTVRKNADQTLAILLQMH
ncbi:MAG: hypothetical protein WB683_03915 [Candidatus Sulfotelmatobacter sp.]